MRTKKSGNTRHNLSRLFLYSRKKKGKENPVDSTQKTAKGQLWHLEANRKRGGLAVHQHESIMASHHFSSSLFFSFFPREETGGEVCAKLWQRSWKSRQEGPGMCDQSKFHISGRSEAQRRKRTNTQQGSRNRNKNEKRKQEKKKYELFSIDHSLLPPVDLKRIVTNVL